MVKVKTKSNKKNISQGVKKNEENVVILPPVRMSDDPTPKQVNIWF